MNGQHQTVREALVGAIETIALGWGSGPMFEDLDRDAVTEAVLAGGSVETVARMLAFLDDGEPWPSDDYLDEDEDAIMFRAARLREAQSLIDLAKTQAEQ